MQDNWRLAWVAFFVAAGLLAFELSLMRILLVASWHHFAFLVITIALLGFGASGTVLTLFRSFFLHRGEASLFSLTLACGLSMPLCVTFVGSVPVESRITPVLLWEQVGLWLIYWAVLFIPFCLGACAIGLALMDARRRVAQVYAANLFGSAAGLAVITSAMYTAPPALLPWVGGALVLLGSAVLQPGRWEVRAGVWAACVALAVLPLALGTPAIRMDPYKYGSRVALLLEQGEAQRVATAYGPRAMVEAYRSDRFHDLPFLSVGSSPPPVSLLLSDGHLAGSVLDVQLPEQAEVMDHTLMASPYAFLPPDPRVLLLGETGGANVWLAVRHRARSIDVVQPDANITALMRDALGSHGGAVLNRRAVNPITTEPRHFVEHAAGRYDLIDLAGLQSSAAGSGGAAGLAENHLVTVEGLTATLRRLTDRGVLAVTRGIQTPPRDNLKLLATIAAALRRTGVVDVGRHIVIIRDYLAVCTMASVTPWTVEQIEAVRKLCDRRELTPVWFPGVRPGELNHPDRLESAPDGTGDWYHFGAARIFDPSTVDGFLRDWSFDIRPPMDDRPFFFNFCKLNAVSAFRKAYGDLWLTRTELAFLFVLAAIAVNAAAATGLTWVPLLVFRFPSTLRGWRPASLYFAAIGLAFMLLEMTFLSLASRMIGDPVVAAGVTIAGFLFFSGTGSLVVQRRWGRAAGRRGGDVMIIVALLALIAVGLVELATASSLARAVGSLSFFARCAAALIATAPLGFLMGFPMPAGLARLHEGGPALVPWVWSVNGFTSVIATPAAVAIGMTWGYMVSGAAALALYLVPLLLFSRLPGGSVTRR
jgi:hypothetical protein